MTIQETYAAVDLGSNSFHMVVANVADGRVQIIDRLKDMVRLAGGLDENGQFDQDTTDRALQCLQRFGQRIREIPRANIRAVGTNTLRIAENSSTFLKQANLALGHPIEIISGREEARLIYQGVVHTNFNETERRLVVDIGGGSTELAIGTGYEVHLTDSKYIGCVSMSSRFFKNGEITVKKMNKAILFAQQEFESIQAIYRKTGWDTVIGSSGTILAATMIIQEIEGEGSQITQRNLIKLKKKIIGAGNAGNLKFNSLTSDRAPVFAGGIAILCAIFEQLGLDTMMVSEGALREGILHDLVGRLHDQDIRDRTIENLVRQYNIDTEHAEHLENTVVNCYQQIKDAWSLDKNDRKYLRWASKIHEIGLNISHNQYHKHGAYLVNYSDLAGFSREEQKKLAFLIRSHRRKFPLDEYQLLGLEEKDRTIKLCIILRLAVILNRSRIYAPLPQFKLSAATDSIKIIFPDQWLESHPLTAADLETEAGYLEPTGIKLLFE